jgi:hypothetical protein
MEGLMKLFPVLFLALVACGDQSSGNAMTNAQVPDGPMPAGAPPLPKALHLQKCEMPRLDLSSVEALSEKDRARFTQNFRVAFDKACTEKLFGDGYLTDERSHDRSVLYVVAANEANIASIYFAPSGAPPATMMEVPFRDPPQIPSVEELHETIYCWAKGATEEEQETTGRCLPD